MKKIIALLALTLSLTAHAANNLKVQQQGVKTITECIAAGASPAQCLITACQIWDTGNNQQLCTTLSHLGSVAPTATVLTNEGVTTTGTLTTPSVCVSAVGNLQGINLGAGVIDSTQGSAIQSTTSVVGLPGSCPSGQVQLSLAATPSNHSNIPFTTTLPGTLLSGSNCINPTGSISSISLGNTVTDSTNPSAIPGVTTVTGLPGSCPSGFIQMSAAATSSETGDTLVFTQNATGTLTFGSACVTSMSSSAGILPGQIANSPSLPSGTSVVGVPGTCGAGNVQLNNTATPINIGDTLIFGSQPQTSGSMTIGSACITSVGSLGGIVVGAPIYDASNTSAFPANAVVSAIPGTCSSGQIQMSANSLVNDSGDTIYFGGFYVVPPGASYLKEKQVGGGGGGGCNGGTGATGGTTSFGASLLFTPGGQGGVAIGNGGLGGGQPTVNLPAIQIVAVQGGAGSPSNGGIGASNVQVGSGPGGNTPFGGAGAGTNHGNGIDAAPDTGSGGGGCGQTGGSGGDSSGSGGGGSYLEALFKSLASGYPYFVGLGGSPASGSLTGGHGATAQIDIEAY